MLYKCTNVGTSLLLSHLRLLTHCTPHATHYTPHATHHTTRHTPYTIHHTYKYTILHHTYTLRLTPYALRLTPYACRTPYAIHLSLDYSQVISQGTYRATPCSVTRWWCTPLTIPCRCWCGFGWRWWWWCSILSLPCRCWCWRWFGVH